MTALFWKACGCALIAAVLVLVLGKDNRDLALVLGMAACVMILSVAFLLFEPILEFLKKLSQLGDLRSGVLGILLKVTGIGITGEIAGILLTDSGNASLSKGVHMVSTGLILSLSLPIFETLLEMIQSILGGL